MPPQPTIQNGSQNDRPVRPQDRKSDIICRVKYCNTLPDIPFDLKFLTYPFENDRFVQYNPTSLERNYKFEVLTEHDLGVNIDLINRDLYQPDRNAVLDPADEKLLEEDSHAPQDKTRSKQHAKSVSWLRRSEYISTEQTRFQPQNMEKAEAKVGYNVKHSQETLYMDREQQINAINKTFEESKKPVKQHYCKPNVVPVEVYPVYPDFKNWKYPCAQVIFDADPSPGDGKTVPTQMEEMSQAMIRGVMDESGEQFVAYFLPTEDTLEKRRTDVTMERAYEEETEYEYKMAREYNWNVKSKLQKGFEENFFLVIREEGVYYNELETRVRLSKRRQKMGAQGTNTKLVVKHRSLNAPEHKMQVIRDKQLEPQADDDEESEESEHEEAAPAAKTEDVEMKDEKRRSRSRSGSRSSHSRSRSRSRSGSGSGRNSRSRSRSRSHSSGSRSSKSGSRSRSRSGSRASKRSGSHRSGSAGSRHSGSRHSTSRSRSRSRSRSGSAGSKSSQGSRRSARSRRSGSGKSGSSRSRSRSGSESKSNHSGSGSD